MKLLAAACLVAASFVPLSAQEVYKPGPGVSNTEIAKIAETHDLMTVNFIGVDLAWRSERNPSGGSRHASCHTSNLTLYPGAASVKLANLIRGCGFEHPQTGAAPSSRIVAEVYPHAGMVALFDLPKVIKYKKGRLADRWIGVVRSLT